jgi:hypothetical protein
MNATPEDTGIHGEGYHYLNILRDRFHKRSVDAGWWAQLDRVKAVIAAAPIDEQEAKDLSAAVEKWFVGTKFMLVVSEVAEMMEGYRKNLMDDHLPGRRMSEVESGDVYIRMFDLDGFLQHDCAGAVHDKGEYNLVRPDHKIETRESGEAGAKAF